MGEQCIGEQGHTDCSSVHWPLLQKDIAQCCAGNLKSKIMKTLPIKYLLVLSFIISSIMYAPYAAPVESQESAAWLTKWLLR